MEANKSDWNQANQTKKLEQPYSIKNKWKQPNQEQTTAHTNKTKENKTSKDKQSNQEGKSKEIN